MGGLLIHDLPEIAVAVLDQEAHAAALDFYFADFAQALGIFMLNGQRARARHIVGIAHAETHIVIAEIFAPRFFHQLAPLDADNAGVTVQADGPRSLGR